MASFRKTSAAAAFGAVAFTIPLTLSAFALTHPQVTRGVSEEKARFFEARVRPILAERCLPCHGADKQSGGLRLDSKEGLLKGGKSGFAVVPGEADKSLLIRSIRYDGTVKMPPTGKLRPAEISALTEWVKMGAPWPDEASAAGARRSAAGEMVITDEQRRFWSFRPVVRPAIPPVRNTSWVRNPIDAFVLAKLEAAGLKPAPSADRRTLLRRASFDLIGLPPTPEEIEAFLNDRSPTAWARVVERLLASPHYGERWGRHWLDMARYADSNGLDENKAFANAYHYRDYVINSLNTDKPFDQFVTEQLAGDLLPAESDEQRNEQTTATGFLVLGAKVLAEQDKPKLVMDIVDEQIEVVSKAFMGLTVSCARCHDHKFDPIPTRDYYALAGIFKSTRTMKNLGFVSEWMEKPLLTAELRAQQKAFDRTAAVARSARDAAVDAANSGVIREIRKHAAEYLIAGWKLAADGGLLSVADSPAKPGEMRIVREAEEFDRASGVVVETLSYGKGIGVIINNAGRDEIEWDVSIPTARPYQVELRYAAAESRPVRLLLNGKLLNETAAAQVTGSWNPEGQRWEPQGIFSFREGKNTLRIERDGPIPHLDKILIASAVGSTGKKVRTAEEIARESRLEPDVLTKWAQRLRTAADDPIFSAWRAFAVLPDSDFSTRGPQIAQSIARGELSGKVSPVVAEAFRDYRPASLGDVAARFAGLFNGPANPLTDRFDLPGKPERFYSEVDKARVSKAEDELKRALARAPVIPYAMAVEDAKIENCRIQVRGSTLNLGEEVPRHFLSVLDGSRVSLDYRHSGRLQLAQWLTQPGHPLTSRVAVNRIWQGHFGQGLVRTPDNWGRLGERPTHPQLLDWLAAELMNPSVQAIEIQNQTPWSLKHLHRLILTSNTYKMGAAANTRAMQVDPENRLLWRANMRRLEAEPYRDALLAVSGCLDPTIGGSLLTTKNNEYVTNDQSGNAARYDNHRRSVYLPVIRNAVFDMFQAFDFGDPSMVNARRASTTVAPQALYILNSPFVLEQARLFAKRLLSESGLSDGQRIQRAYLIALARPAGGEEISEALGYIKRYVAALASEGAAADRAEKAWTSFCQLLLASNEFIYVN